ncbi:MAG TPA: ABC transporter ATP-binding protein [Actinomycetota bacterium]|nr:ABC transporter ATP-binding protein [Actinomycetota bacterium]
MADAATEARPTPTSAGDGVAVRFEGVTKRFGDVLAVDGVDLEVREREFFSMLGPSGSGKTTCLRMIAGFEEPTSGRIVLAGADVSGRAPFDRDVNTVFQDYALFPHMTVAENVGYGLMVRKIDRTERRGRIDDALEMVRLGGFADRKPAQLSGGQRQRVALARALVLRPAVLLLDEPLGALDLKLRQTMQVELKDIQQRVGITFVYVTHDQEEALAMSDRLAVFNAGRIEQVGTPSEVYERPASGFVAGFVGVSNVLEGSPAERIVGSPHAVTIRPEKIHLELDESAPVGTEQCSAAGEVTKVVYLGAVTRYTVTLDAGAELVVMQQNLRTTSSEALQVRGRRVRLVWDRQHSRPVEPAGRSEVGPGGRGSRSDDLGEGDA